MNKKQKGILAILVLITSTLVVVGIVSVVPWYFPYDDYTSVPSAPELDEIIPNVDTDGIISLSWSVSDRAWYYNIFRRFGSIETIIKTMVIVNSFVDSTTKEEGTYIYRIEAENNVGKVQSNEKTVIIDLPELPPVPPVPDAPILRLMVNGPNTDGEIKLEWDLVSGATMYTIYRWKDGLNEKILNQDFSENYYDDLVSSNGVYSYKVKAGNIEKEYSEYSNEVSITVQMAGVPDVPVMNQLEYEIINYTIKVYIDWDAVDCDSYVLYRSFNGEIYKPVEGILSTSSTIYAEILTEAGTYVYKVSAVNTYGGSGLSNSVTIEVTKDGGVAPPPTDYTTLYILLGFLVVLIVPVVILVKRKKR